MSELQSDKEIIENKSNRYKDIDAPLRDQIPSKLLKKLRDRDVGAMVERLWNTGNADRSNWLKRQQAFLSQWDEFLDTEVQGPYELSSNLHLPMTFIVAKTYHARMLQALESVDPTARPRRPDSADRAQAVSEVMRYSVTDWVNEFQGMAEVNDCWVWDWVTTGVGIMKWRWEAKYTRFVDVETVMVPGEQTIVTLPDGSTQVVPNLREVEREINRTKEVFRGPVAERVAPEDLLLIGGGGDPQTADAALHRQWLTKSEMYQLAYQKIFDEDEVDAVIKAGPDSESQDQATSIKQQASWNAGSINTDTEADLDRYAIVECWMKYDVDNSGVDSDIVVWVHPQTKRILRATYAYRINQTGRRPFVKIDFFKRPAQDYGFGLVEALYPLQKELDMFHNTRVDFGMLSTAPFGFYRAGSSLDPETIRLEPGMLIPVDNPATDIVFPNLGNRTSFGMQEEAGIMGMIERLTGVNELTLGALTGVQGPTRTATGAQALMSESNANLDVHLRRMFKGLKQSYEYLLNMLQLRVEPGFAYRLTADEASDYWGYVKSRQDLAGDFDFILDPSSAASNPQIRQQRAQQTLQITSNPLNLQLGIVSPANHYNALRDFLNANGIKAFSKYITEPANSAVRMTPEEMANRILRGDDLIPAVTDDNAGFIAFVDNILKSDELLGQFSEAETRALVSQQQERRQLLAAVQQQQAQQANLQQIQQNLASSVNPQVGAAPLQ